MMMNYIGKRGITLVFDSLTQNLIKTGQLLDFGIFISLVAQFEGNNLSVYKNKTGDT
jgi:hypothetical protein